jgi:hypothetical protein
MIFQPASGAGNAVFPPAVRIPFECHKRFHVRRVFSHPFEARFLKPFRELDGRCTDFADARWSLETPERVPAYEPDGVLPEIARGFQPGNESFERADIGQKIGAIALVGRVKKERHQDAADDVNGRFPSLVPFPPLRHCRKYPIGSTPHSEGCSGIGPPECSKVQEFEHVFFDGAGFLHPVGDNERSLFAGNGSRVVRARSRTSSVHAATSG